MVDDQSSGGEQDRGPGPGAEQARVHDREQLVVRVPHATSSSRNKASRRSTAASTARTTANPGNEDVISASGNVVAANGVTYDGLPKLMKAMGAKKVAALAYGISASSTAAAENLQKFAVPAVGLEGRLHQHHRRLRQHRRRPAGARHQELRRRRRLPAARRRLQHRGRAGPRPERREDEVHRVGHRLRAAAPRPAGLGDLRARGHHGRPDSHRSSSRPRPPSSSRPTSRSTPATPACPTTASTPATSPATWPSWAWRTRATHPPGPRSRPTCASSAPTTRRAWRAVRSTSARDLRPGIPTSCGWYVQIKDGKFVLFPPKGKSAKTPWEGKLIEESTVAPPPRRRHRRSSAGVVPARIGRPESKTRECSDDSWGARVSVARERNCCRWDRSPS